MYCSEDAYVISICIYFKWELDVFVTRRINILFVLFWLNGAI